MKHYVTTLFTYGSKTRRGDGRPPVFTYGSKTRIACVCGYLSASLLDHEVDAEWGRHLKEGA